MPDPEKPEVVIPVQEVAPDKLIVATDDAPEHVADTETQEAGAGDSTVAAAAAADDRKPEKLPDWATKKMGDLAAQARRAEKRAIEAEAAAKANAKPTTADAEAAREAAPDGGFKTQADFDAAVKSETEKRINTELQKADQEAFNARANAVYDAGTEAFKEDFKTAVGNLQAVGVLGADPVSVDILNMIMETDAPSQVIYELGKDTTKAAALLNMTPAKRAIEIAKIAALAGAPKKQAEPSKVPPPVKTVDGSVRVSGDPRDDDDDATWFAKREAQLRSRDAA